MSEILFDHIHADADGSLRLTIRVLPAAGESAPGDASIHLTPRGGTGGVRLPARLGTDGAGVWQATCAIPPDALDGVPADVTVLDCVAHITIDGDVQSARLGWDTTSSRFLPYPTATRRLSLRPAPR